MNDPIRHPLSRRTFVMRLGAIGAFVPLLALIGCDQADPPASIAPNSDGPTPAAPPADGAVCDASKLSEAEKAPRNALAYTDQTLDPAKSCDNCSLYIADIGGCPGCKLFKGPVAPKGTCKSWAPA